MKAVPDEVEMVVFYSTEEVMKAKEFEVQSWQENDVYEEVEDTGQEFISVRWVITEKLKDGKPVVKARLVAMGFEEDTSDFGKGSPACSKESIRLALALASAFGWECHSLDVKSAYLQGNYIEREVYLHPPPEYYSGQLWRLRKTVYGLCDAARAWYLRVKSQLWYVHLNHLCFLGTMMVSFMVSYVYTWMISSGWALECSRRRLLMFFEESSVLAALHRLLQVHRIGAGLRCWRYNS